ncbi:MAG: flavodoxin family protein [Selenomonadaceae bacterium]|nr:flavodoxin family protein [Selenomonadaceae bacterium]MBQ6759290.1 flavodoxin family protein [Selenomonadaceae bacterium]MBR0102288.1 flavodoxin family protein [Selenomonadaceae bacterium]MBR6712950.1 flavodoxin family protein [Selenomonadaceae bacterium]
MKNLIAINGSPRRNGNTAELLKHAMQGAKDSGASAELINLYALNFKGCTSCFACKLKSRPHGSCAMKDDLSPVLEKVKSADAVIFGSPIYFMNLSAGMIAFIERLFFSNYIYSDEIPTVFPKKLPSAFIYTMNMTEKHFEEFNMQERLGMYEIFTERILAVAPKVLRAFDTVQFKDYSRYESSIFNPEEKFAHREKYFPEDCKAAYEIGRDLVK